jgi:O-antigen/teichoic acid export membrane protein
VSYIRNVSITLAAKIIMALVGLATSIILARMLGPDGRGIYALVILSAIIVFRLTHMGIGTGSGYFLGRKQIPYEKLAGTWLSLSVLIGFSSLGLALVLAPFVAPLIFPSVDLVLILVALLSVPFAVILSNFSQLFRANNDFRRFNALELAQPVFFLIFYVFYVFVVMGGQKDFIILGPGFKVVPAVLSFLFSFVAAGALSFFMTWSRVRLRFRWTRDLVKRAVSFGLQGHLAGIVKFLNLRLDMLLVNIFIDPTHVGYYAISVMVAEKIWYIPDVLSIALHPRVAHAGDEQANRDTAIVSRQTIIIVSAACIFILLLGRPLVALLYSDLFLPAVVPLLILLPGVLASSLSRVISSDLMARGYPRVILWAGLTGLVVNVSLNVILIPRLGIAGAALASTISYSLDALVMLAAFVRITALGIRSLLVPGSEDFRLLIKSIKKVATFSGE